MTSINPTSHGWGFEVSNHGRLVPVMETEKASPHGRPHATQPHMILPKVRTYSSHISIRTRMAKSFCTKIGEPEILFLSSFPLSHRILPSQRLGDLVSHHD